MIHRIHGRSLAEALRRAREELGEQALVLSQEAEPSGAVTIAVADARGDARRAAPPADPGLADLRARLERHGASRALVEHVAEAVEASGVRGAYALDAAARAIGRVFPRRPSPKRDGRTRVVAFVGPSGAGKTTTAAKIGRRLAEGGRSVLFASLDGLGVAALEHHVHAGGPARSVADSDRHEVAIHALGSTAEIDEREAVRAGLDVVLLDTPGVGVRDADGVARLAAELGRLGREATLETHLVLPATHDAAALTLAHEAFAPVLRAVERAGGEVGCVVTKLDETPHPARVLEHCRRAKLPLAFLCDGADARGHLRLARADNLADLLLRGRMAA